MAKTAIVQNSFSQGELGPYMLGRSDNQIFHSGAKQLENWLVLPQGGVQRRRGFAYVDTLTGTASEMRLVNFQVGATLQYVLIFLNGVTWIYLNDAKAVTLSTPWASADVKSLRIAQSGNTMVVTHPNYSPYQIQHDPAAMTWAATPIPFVNINFYRFNTTQSLTPSDVTGSITLTLSGSTPYFTANHVGIQLRVNWQVNNPPDDPPSGNVTITAVDAGGLSITATVNSALGSTAADPAWSEWAWSAAHGYPVANTFFQNRLVFGGTRDAPYTIFASKTADVYNFDDSQPVDNFSYAFTLSTDQNESILDIRSYLQALAIFTNVGEHLLSTQTGPVTPSNVYIQPQTNFGISPEIPTLQLEYQIISVINNGKEVRKFLYQYYLNRFETTSLTTVSHQLFQDGTYPVSMAYLRDYADTEANYLFVVREDGQMAACALDTDKGVLAWSRLTTQGSFVDCSVVRADHGDGINKDTLYVIVQRDNGIFLEYLTEDEAYVDCYFDGTSGTPKTTWSGLTPLENQLAQVVGDGTVQVSQTVSNSGSITIPNAVSDIVVGLEYDSMGETMPLIVTMDGQQLRGLPLSKAFVSFAVVNTQSLILDGFNVNFRNLGDNLLDQGLISFTGEQHIAIGGSPTILSPTLTFNVTEPLPCTLLVLTTELNIGASR